MSTKYTCTYSGETVGVLFRLVSDTGSPISGVQIKGQSVVYCNTERQVQALPPATTNSSGWADMRDGNGGNYYLTFGYAGTSYNVMISVEPVALTLATLKLPSGILTTQDLRFRKSAIMLSSFYLDSENGFRRDYNTDHVRYFRRNVIIFLCLYSVSNQFLFRLLPDTELVGQPRDEHSPIERNEPAEVLGTGAE